MTKTQGRERLARAGVEPLGLDRLEAAAFIGVSETLFLSLVADGRMPQPRRINTREVWSRLELARAFEDLPRAAPAATTVSDKWAMARA